MSEKRDVPCADPACSIHTPFWRQCPFFLCALDIGFCTLHGGEGRAEKEMRKHLEQHPAQDAR